MAQHYSVVVHFRADRLSSEQRHNPFMRREVLNEGIGTLRKEFPTAVFGPPRVPSLSVVVHVSSELLPELIEFIDKNRLGDAIMEGQMLRAVRDGIRNAERIRD